MGIYVMENILLSQHIYGDSWNVKSSRNFNEEEKACVERAEVVQSNFGFSVCFHMVGGGVTFIPLSNRSKLAPGEPVDMETVKLLTLEKSGENDILRVEE